MTTLFHHAKRTDWQKMNRIQKGGVIAAFTFLCIGFDETRLGLIASLIGITSLYLGYVIGYIVRLRHALHFWWSCFGACVAHGALLPVYTKLMEYIRRQPRTSGREYVYLMLGPVIAQTLVSIFLIKQIAIWQQRRRVPGWGVR